MRCLNSVCGDIAQVAYAHTLHHFLLQLRNIILSKLLHTATFTFHVAIKLIIAQCVVVGPSLRYIELPMELITHTVLHELANKCPNLNIMLLDFSTAMQLHDFSDLHSFPTKLRTMCICLSEVTLACDHFDA